MNESREIAAPVDRCDHICLLPDGHTNQGRPHFYGYELPSPRKLQAHLDDRNAWCDHLAARESALLLAVPRPFRMFIHRRAERIQRQLEAQ